MATKKISELEAITEADGSDVLAIVDVSEGKTNKITKNNLLKGSGHTIEMSLNENYQIVLKLKNAEGTELSTATIDLPNENAITNISYSNGTLTLTKQSGTTSQVDISGLINGLATETALTNLANALKETIGIDTNTYNESQTYNTGDIVIQNEKIYKANQDNITGTFDSSKWDEISLYEYQKLQDEAIEENYKVITKLQEDVEDLTERVEDAENNEMTYTPEKATSHYLQDSAGSRFRKFIPIGRTTQESTSGANVMKFTPRTVSNQGINYICNDEGSVKLTGTATAGLELAYNQSQDKVILASGTYKLKCVGNNIPTVLKRTDTNTSFNLDSNGEATITIDADNTEFRILIIATNGTTYNYDFYITLAAGTATTERYTGGEPAPNPNYVIPYKNTGDNVNEFDITKRLLGTIDENGDLVIDGTTRKFYEDDFRENTQYTLSAYVKSPSGTVRFKLFYTDGNSTDLVLYNGTDEYKYMTFTTPENKTLDYIAMYYGNVGKMYIKNAELKIEQGTKATPYSPYGCGNVNEKVQNFNIWDEQWEVGGINNSNGENYASTSLIRSKNYISVQPNTQYYIKNSTDYAWFYAYDKNKNFLGYAFGSSSSVANEIKTTIANCYYIRFQCRSQYGTTYNNDICINISNTALNGTYISHSEQNPSFPLSSGQKLMQGDYPADDEKVHHVSGEMLFDGSSDENWIYNPTYAYFYITTTGFKSADFCDNYSKETSETLTNNHFRFNPNNGNLYIKDERFTSASSFKTNLATNNIILQGELAEEQTEDFTEEQKTAYPEWKKARTYKNITHISSEDETPANVDIEYVVDINTIDDRITALEAKVDLLEE